MSNLSNHKGKEQVDSDNVLQNLSRRLQEDPGATLRRALEADMLVALAVAAAKEPGAYQKLLLDLRDAGLKVKDIEALKRAVKEQRRLRVVTPGERPEMTKAGAVIDDAPVPDQIIPYPYFIGPGATGYYKLTDDGTVPVRVAHAPILITQTLFNVTDGTISLELSWRVNGRWSQKVVGRGVVLNARKLVELAAAGFPVSSGTADKLVDFLHDLEAANRHQLPYIRVSSRLGWQGKNGEEGFLWGYALIPPGGGEPIVTDIDEEAEK